MNKLVMSALLLGVVAQAGGCIFVSDSGSGTASVHATWSLKNKGAPASCPAGADTATVYAQRPSDSQPFTDIFNCSDGSGTAANLPSGDYMVWVEITDHSGQQLYAQSESVQISLSDGQSVTADFSIDVANGFFDVSWNIDNANHTPTSCAQVTNHGVSILSTLANTTTASETLVDCTAGEAPAKTTTDAVPLGQLVVSIALLQNQGGQDVAIGQAPDINTSLDYGNQFRDLGTVTITLF